MGAATDSSAGCKWSHEGLASARQTPNAGSIGNTCSDQLCNTCNHRPTLDYHSCTNTTRAWADQSDSRSLSKSASCRGYSATSSQTRPHDTRTCGNSSSTAKQTATRKTTRTFPECSVRTTRKKAGHSRNGFLPTQRPRRLLPRNSHPHASRDRCNPQAVEEED